MSTLRFLEITALSYQLYVTGLDQFCYELSGLVRQESAKFKNKIRIRSLMLETQPNHCLGNDNPLELFLCDIA